MSLADIVMCLIINTSVLMILFSIRILAAVGNCITTIRVGKPMTNNMTMLMLMIRIMTVRVIATRASTSTISSFEIKDGLGGMAWQAVVVNLAELRKRGGTVGGEVVGGVGRRRRNVRRGLTVAWRPLCLRAGGGGEDGKGWRRKGRALRLGGVPGRCVRT